MVWKISKLSRFGDISELQIYVSLNLGRVQINLKCKYLELYVLIYILENSVLIFVFFFSLYVITVALSYFYRFSLWYLKIFA